MIDNDDSEDTQEIDSDDNDDRDALLSRLRVIEDQPLESRAAAFAQVHDQLQSRLDGQ